MVCSLLLFSTGRFMGRSHDALDQHEKESKETFQTMVIIMVVVFSVFALLVIGIPLIYCCCTGCIIRDRPYRRQAARAAIVRLLFQCSVLSSAFC